MKPADQFLEQVSSLQGSTDYRHLLIQHYGGHPLALRLAATVIQDLFSGEIPVFLDAIRHGGFPIAGLTPVLKRCVDDLSEEAQALLHQIAFSKHPLSIPELRHQISEDRIRWQLPFILQTLQRRSLLQSTPQGLHLLPMISEYLVYRFVSQMELDPSGEHYLPSGV